VQNDVLKNIKIGSKCKDINVLLAGRDREKGYYLEKMFGFFMVTNDESRCK
jgi:hypothetical protein